LVGVDTKPELPIDVAAPALDCRVVLRREATAITDRHAKTDPENISTNGCRCADIMQVSTTHLSPGVDLPVGRTYVSSPR